MFKNLNIENFQNLIKNGGLSFSESPSSFLFECPKCHKRKLAIHKNKGFWSCYKCKSDGFKGRPENILHILFGMNIDEARSQIYDNFEQFKPQIFLKLNIKDPWDDEISDSVPEYEMDDLQEVILNPMFVDFSSELFEPGKKYLNGRGITEDLIKKHNILYSPFTQSVVFPVKNGQKYYGWQERGIKSDRKYTMPGLQREKALMFFENILDSNHAIITEGPVDALKCDHLGGAVCTMGKIVTDHQLKMIVNKVKTVYVALDPDASVEKNQICNKLSSQCQVYVMTPPEGRKDFGECTPEEAEKAFNEAVPYFGQKFLFLKNPYDR